jgi:hypothetical protein
MHWNDFRLLALVVAIIAATSFVYWFGWMAGRSVGYYEGRRDALDKGDSGE